MRIQIDGHMLGKNEGGNERYVINLYKYLAEEKKVQPSIIITKNYCSKLPVFKEKNIVRMQFDNDFYRLLFFIPQEISRNHIDILHSTYVLPFRKKSKFVLTVHDLLFKRHPEFFSLKEKLIFTILFPWSIARADAIIVPSKFVKKEIAEFYPQYADKTLVVYDGVGKKFNQVKNKKIVAGVLKRLNITDPFLLTINSKYKKKNIETVIQSFLQLQKKHAGLKLVIVGGSANISDKYKRMKDLIILDYVGDDDLIVLYSACRIFIYYSLYEGFGLPILEAAACGALVVCSDIEVHREISRGLVPLADPQDPIDLFRKIDLFLSNSIFERKVRSDERHLSAFYSWRKTAQKTIKVYKYLLK